MENARVSDYGRHLERQAVAAIRRSWHVLDPDSRYENANYFSTCYHSDAPLPSFTASPAALPPPNAGYPVGDTAEGQNALLTLTTVVSTSANNNTTFGTGALFITRQI